jgi:hypothetical protein
MRILSRADKGMATPEPWQRAYSRQITLIYKETFEVLVTDG